MLPDFSKWVHVRDILLVLFLLPFVFVKNKLSFLYDVWECFAIVVLIKALCIFFTFVPPSNPDCYDKKYMNHCFHNAVSGHTALAYILAFFYVRHGVFEPYIYAYVTLYCIFILMTRAHYTKDVIEALVVVSLIIHS